MIGSSVVTDIGSTCATWLYYWSSICYWPGISSFIEITYKIWDDVNTFCSSISRPCWKLNAFPLFPLTLAFCFWILGLLRNMVQVPTNHTFKMVCVGLFSIFTVSLLLLLLLQKPRRQPSHLFSKQQLGLITNQIDERRAVWTRMHGLWPPSHLALPVPSAACLYPGDSCASPASRKQGCRAAAAAAHEQIWRSRQVKGKRKPRISWMLKMACGFRTQHQQQTCLKM